MFTDLFTDAAETENMAKSLEDSEGVYFVPSFSGLQVCKKYLMAIKHSLLILTHKIMYLSLSYLKIWALNRTKVKGTF